MSHTTTSEEEGVIFWDMINLASQTTVIQSVIADYGASHAVVILEGAILQGDSKMGSLEISREKTHTGVGTPYGRAPDRLRLIKNNF